MRDHSEIIKRLFKLLCSYKEQPVELRDVLQLSTTGALYPEREVLYEQDSVVTDAIFVSDGYAACYAFDGRGDGQVLGLYGKDSIISGTSFARQQPSPYEWLALPGAYLMKMSYARVQAVYAQFRGSEELARLIMAERTEKVKERMRLLKRDAESVVADFYNAYPEFKVPGKLMLDADIASYLMIAESTLRNVRAKLIRDGRW